MAERDAALQKAIDAMDKRLGNAAELAERIGISKQALSQWKRVPSSRVIDVERASGVHRSELRPDLYPPERSEAPGAAA